VKVTSSQTKSIKSILAASFMLHAISIAVIVFLVAKTNSLDYRAETLTNKATELNKQALQFNARTNNLKGCWQNNDYACSENKYFDGDKFVQD
jgi:hypothetical protein